MARSIKIASISVILVTPLLCILPADAQNCVITGGINNGTINQNCIIGRTKLDFDPSIAEELAAKIPTGKPLRLIGVGSASDRAVAAAYAKYLQDKGLNLEFITAGMIAPPPDHPITIDVSGKVVTIVIAAGAY